jgi:hypothetical protein
MVVLEMAVKWAKFEETSTTGYMPTTSANTWSVGANIQGGAMEFLQLRYDLTFADNPVPLGDISSLVSSMRIILNGEVVHDFTAGYANNATVGPSQYNYLLNHIGGRFVEDPTSATPQTRVGYINIPLGRQTPNGVNRLEIITSWAAAAQAISSGSMSWWCRFNDGMQKITTVVPATSFNHTSGAYEQVVVRVPQNAPKGSVVSGLLVLNDEEADEYGSSGLRINALSDFGIPISMYRAQNGDSLNGIMWNKGSTNTADVQDFSTRLSGAILIPTLGLAGGDIVLSVDSSATTVRRYMPILTAPVGAKAGTDVVQTQTATGNTAKAILRGSLE